MRRVVVSFEVLFAIAVGAGFVGAMSGMGGGTVLIPALTLLGMDIKHAIAASIVSVIATSSGSASAYVRDHITNLKAGMFLEIFTILGALAGATLTLASGQRVLFILFGVVLLITWGTLLKRGGGKSVRAASQDRFSRWLDLDGEYYDQADRKVIGYRVRRAYLGGPMMFGAGMLAGLLGIGAGALKVLILEYLMGLPLKVSTTTSNLIIGVTALAGTSVYLAAGLVEPEVVAPVILGVVLGAMLATRLLVRLESRTVRKFFMLILLILGVQMLIRGFRGS
jgi:uncharacterized membrane protein YfcA